MSGRIWSGRAVAVVVCAAVFAGGCSSSGGDDVAESGSGDTTTSAVEATTTTVATGALDILVSNDDGYDAPGIDAVVEALRALPDTNVTVVAPAENQSGTGGNTTDGELTVTDEQTLSGYPVVAVQGFPADAVNYGLDEVLDETPDLVVTGINAGQNIGPLTDVSGTVGAAEAAAARGIPALASSQGLDADPPDYPAGVDEVLAWVDEHRDAILAGDAPVQVDNLNIPSCATGELRGQVEVPVATDDGGRAVNDVDCTSTAEDPVDDIAGFTTGFATLSVIEVGAAAG